MGPSGGANTSPYIRLEVYMSSGSKIEPQRFEFTGRGDYRTFAPPGTLSTSTPYTYSIAPYRANTRSWGGQDKYDYLRLITEREDASNSYSKSLLLYNLGSFSIDEELSLLQYFGNPNPKYELVDSYRMSSLVYSAPSDPGPGSHLSDAVRIASQSFTRKARQQLSEAQALVTAGELRESVRMVLNARRSLFSKLQSFQFSAKKRAKGKLTVKQKKKAVAESWLEYSFGWAPLVADVSNLANAAAATISGSMRSFDIRSTGRSKTSVEEGAGWYGSPGWLLYTYDINRRTVTATRCHFAATTDVDIDQPGNFSSQFGLTMDNWVPSIWELVPWSFAVDYFTGLGDFLSSITLPWSNFRYITKTLITEKARSHYYFRLVSTLVNDNTHVQKSTITPSNSNEVVNVSISRERVYNVIRWPSLRIPGYKEAYINLGALAALRNNNRL